MRLWAMVLLSAALTSGVMFHAFQAKQQFYPAVVYVMQSNPLLLVRHHHPSAFFSQSCPTHLMRIRLCIRHAVKPAPPCSSPSPERLSQSCPTHLMRICVIHMNAATSLTMVLHLLASSAPRLGLPTCRNPLHFMLFIVGLLSGPHGYLLAQVIYLQVAVLGLVATKFLQLVFFGRLRDLETEVWCSLVPSPNSYAEMF